MRIFIKNIRKLLAVRFSIFGLSYMLAAVVLCFVKSNALLHRIDRSYFAVIMLKGVIGFFFARTAGMCFNQYLDRKIDENNSRTSNRVIPAKEMHPIQVLVIGCFSLLVFLGIAWTFNPICFDLSILSALFIAFHAYSKRFTSYAHFIMAAVHGLGCLITYSAITQTVSLEALLLGLVSWLIVAANDIIYSTVDIEFDKLNKLCSFPEKYGLKKSFYFAEVLYLFAFFMLIVLGVQLKAGVIYFIFVCYSSMKILNSFRDILKIDKITEETTRIILKMFYLGNARAAMTVLFSLGAGLLSSLFYKTIK